MMEQNNTADTTDTTTAVVCNETWLTQSEVNARYGTRIGNVLSSAAKNTSHAIDRRKREGTKRWEYKESDIRAWMEWQQEKSLAARQREDAPQKDSRGQAVLINGMNAQELVDRLTEWGNDLNEQGKDLMFKEVFRVGILIGIFWIITQFLPFIGKLFM